MSDFSVMMFAAGFGTRMGALTQTLPKPMIQVAGKPLIDHALHLAKAEGCTNIVANLHYRPEILQAYLTPQGVQTVLEHPDILETGGGLRNALPLLGTAPVVTMNTDAVWSGPNPVALLREHWNPDRMDALLMCVPAGQTLGYVGQGDFTLAQDGVLRRGPGHVYGGIQITKTDLLSEIDEKVFSLNELWDRMLAKNRLFGLSYSGVWCDVGHPAGISQAEEMLEQADV